MLAQSLSRSVSNGTRRPMFRLRRGSFTVWLLVAAPVMLLMLVSVTGIGSLWLARSELSNLADATALTGAKLWGDLGDSAATRTQVHYGAAAIAQANTILGVSSPVDPNDDPLAINNNAACPGTITLGRLTSSTFAADEVPLSVGERACRVELLTSINLPFFGSVGSIGPFTIRASAVARYDGASPGTGTPRLVNITAATCP